MTEGSKLFTALKKGANRDDDCDDRVPKKCDDRVPRKKKRRGGGHHRKKVQTECDVKGNYMTCCALACNNTSESHIMTCLPINPKRRREWLNRINQKNYVSTVTSALCEDHFDSNAWERDALGGKILKSDVLPTQYLNGEAIKSWITLDKSGKVTNETIRISTDEESNDEMSDSSVSIKKENLELNNEMAEASSGVKNEFETIYLESYNLKCKNEIIEKIKDEHLDEPETIEPERFPSRIKTKHTTDEGDQTTTWSSCHECGQSFKDLWNLEQHLVQKHSVCESAKSLPSKQDNSSTELSKANDPHVKISSTNILKFVLKPSVTRFPARPISRFKANPVKRTEKTIAKVGLPSQAVSNTVVGHTTPKQFLVLMPQTSYNKTPMFLPVKRSNSVETQPPSTMITTSPLDSSETFTISLAKFPASMRLAIKRKMLDLLEAVDKLNINPETIVIAHNGQ